MRFFFFHSTEDEEFSLFFPYQRRCACGATSTITNSIISFLFAFVFVLHLLFCCIQSEIPTHKHIIHLITLNYTRKTVFGRIIIIVATAVVVVIHPSIFFWTLQSNDCGVNVNIEKVVFWLDTEFELVGRNKIEWFIKFVGILGCVLRPTKNLISLKRRFTPVVTSIPTGDICVKFLKSTNDRNEMVHWSAHRWKEQIFWLCTAGDHFISHIFKFHSICVVELNLSICNWPRWQRAHTFPSTKHTIESVNSI